jgi:hypothetical protein
MAPRKRTSLGHDKHGAAHHGGLPDAESKTVEAGPGAHFAMGLGEHSRGHSVPGNLAMDGAPKRHGIGDHPLGVVPVHMAMKDRAHLVGVGAAISSNPPDASSPRPLDKEAPSKSFVGQPVPMTLGMGRQTTGGIGDLPKSVTSSDAQPVRKP